MIPEVRQDCRPSSKTFGFVAVKQDANSPLGEWAYMSPKTGGGALTAEQVKDWTVLINPGLAIEAAQ